MAFTLAHMAAALPFYPAKRWLHFEALLIGTMMPDFPYYFGSNSATGDLSHEWVGVFAYCLPWGLVAFSLWYWGLKPAALSLIQPFVKGVGRNTDNKRYDSFDENLHNKHRRITGYADRYWSLASFKKRTYHWLRSFWPTVAFGLILGAATHIVWDGITHADGSIARHIDWLQYPLYFFPFKGTSIARLLQYLSSMAGLLALFWFSVVSFRSWRRNNRVLDRHGVERTDVIKPILTKKHSLVVIGLMTVLAAVSVMRAVVQWYPSMTSSPYSFAAGVSVIVLKDMAAICIGYALIYHLVYFSRCTYLWYKKN